jgi:probable F420-dependent oxidoreductase
MDLGRIGIWSPELRRGELAVAGPAAAELEALGYGALWFPGGSGGAVLERAGALLEATERVVVATGILNVWMHEPADAAADHARLTGAHPGRFLLGIGIGHAPQLEPGKWKKPLATMRAYLDGLDAADPPVPAGERALAALGPKMLALAAERSLGTHPYLVTPEHTRIARELLGEGPLVAPEQAVALEEDPGRARALGRAHLERYLPLPNYTNNWLRLGYTEDDLRDGGSDRLVDGLVAWGDEAAIAARVGEHLEAGADHVCLQVLGGTNEDPPLEGWRALAPALGVG